jgi:hypothetical protein
VKIISPRNFIALAFSIGLSAVSAQVEFWTLSGNSSDVNGALDGRTVADRLNSNSYNGYVGEMILMPVDSAFLGSLLPDAPGLVEADGDGAYGGVRGIVGFCIDSETAFATSADLTDIHTYVPLDYATANSRYNGVNNGSGNGVPFYLNGGLLRAAYLMDQFYESAHAGGEIQAAALQAAIWEVLYDATPSVDTGDGNYYVRNNTTSFITNANSNDIIAITDAWFASANADNWGGASYDPTGRVIFWLDPTDTDFNQSIITLNPFEGPVPIPEPGTSMTIAMGAGALLLRRRR